MAVFGVGIDVADVARFGRLLERGGTGFASHWFTADELADSLGRVDPARHLAQRFAAKEAVVKALALRWEHDAARWLEIEVRAIPGTGRGQVQLHGTSRDWAAHVHVDEILLTISTTGGITSALAIAQLGPSTT
jgi:holo-[acyl-carrier protein] synthase